jgi:hypothetical protein
VGVGIGATIDLGGIGQRRPEADPFAVPAGPQPVTARTEEKPPTSKGTKASSNKPKTYSRSHSQRQLNDDGLWSQINPVKKDIPESPSSGIDNKKSETPPQ